MEELILFKMSILGMNLFNHGWVFLFSNLKKRNIFYLVIYPKIYSLNLKDFLIVFYTWDKRKTVLGTWDDTIVIELFIYWISIIVRTIRKGQRLILLCFKLWNKPTLLFILFRITHLPRHSNGNQIMSILNTWKICLLYFRNGMMTLKKQRFHSNLCQKSFLYHSYIWYMAKKVWPLRIISSFWVEKCYSYYLCPSKINDPNAAWSRWPQSIQYLYLLF